MEDEKNQSLRWNAPEYNHKPKNADWIWGIGLVALAGAVISFILGNYFFGIFIILSGIMLIVFSTIHPKECSFEINKDGIFIDKDLFIYKNIKGFKIRDANPYSKLIIETNKYFLPIYMIPVPHGLEEEVYTTLLQIIPETEIDETHSSRFMEKIGF